MRDGPGARRRNGMRVTVVSTYTYNLDISSLTIRHRQRPIYLLGFMVVRKFSACSKMNSLAIMLIF